ncbi:MAG: MarR family transcriptional regulator [Clostridia bacterium]|nr:MarR family transcriptional regulator [Clostridia bacterium]
MTNFDYNDFGILYLRLLNFKNRIEQAERALLSKHGLTRNDTLVISALGVSDLTLSELGKLCCIDKSTITKVVKKLEDNNYIKKTSERMRGYSVMLTEKGKILNEKSMEAFMVLNYSASEFLTADEICSLNNLLDKILTVSEDKLLTEISNRISGQGGKL